MKSKIINTFVLDNLYFIFEKNARCRRTVRFNVMSENTVRVTIPLRISKKQVEEIITKNIISLKELVNKSNKVKKVAGPSYLYVKNRAKKFFTDKVKEWNKFYDFEYNKITVRRQSTRWGSCSRSKNLSFNYKLYLMPIELADYVVVHEICHLREMNHSKQFWQLVSKTMPEYQKFKNELKKWK